MEVSYSPKEENFIDLINIEEELLDPKWYSDLNTDDSTGHCSAQKSSKQYDELVEAVTPFVQFKENLKANNNGEKSSTELKVLKDNEKIVKNVQFNLNEQKTVKPTAKRKLSMAKAVPIQYAVPTTTSTAPAQINIMATQNLSNSTATTATQLLTKVSKTYTTKKRKTDSLTVNGLIKTPENKILPINNNQITNISPSSNTTTIPTNIVINPIACKTTATTIPTTIIKQEPTKEKQTAQILNKLQNLGLQVKRTQPMPPPVAANSSASNKTDTKTLEILQKLQSKGMKVKILNKQQQSIATTTATNTTTMTGANVNNSLVAKPLPALVPNPMQKSSSLSVIRNPAAAMTIKQNLNKNLIIRKVN